jgi:hypothetical protein
MYLYNITFNITDTHAEAFVQHLKTEFIPTVIATKLTVGNTLLRLLTEIENNGQTFSVQFFLVNQEGVIAFDEAIIPALNQVHRQFEGHYVYFNTLLEEL